MTIVIRAIRDADLETAREGAASRSHVIGERLALRVSPEFRRNIERWAAEL